MQVKYYPGALRELGKRLPHLDTAIRALIEVGTPQTLVADTTVDYTQFKTGTLLLFFIWDNTPQGSEFWNKEYMKHT